MRTLVSRSRIVSSDGSVAAHTQLGTSTVDSYRARIKEKLGVRNAAALYQYSAQWLTERGL